VRRCTLCHERVRDYSLDPTVRHAWIGHAHTTRCTGAAPRQLSLVAEHEEEGDHKVEEKHEPTGRAARRCSHLVAAEGSRGTPTVLTPPD